MGPRGEVGTSRPGAYSRGRRGWRGVEFDGLGGGDGVGLGGFGGVRLGKKGSRPSRRRLSKPAEVSVGSRRAVKACPFVAEGAGLNNA